ncbi:cobaltochelatase subunit CobN [Pseudogracilibacillus sp. SO30301A]|uniref:cobaltochelatase subunit CobN n=1 Tax=Pseudogracilibacillus sp. SO30301A TaxID=3098291 RepID=UPI003FA72F1F
MAATTNKVDNWIFSHVHDTYVEDKALQENNPSGKSAVYHDMMGTLIEVSERRYWKPSESQ